MKRLNSVAVAAMVVIHFAYLVYVPSGGFMALRRPRTIWLHVLTVVWGIAVATLHLPCPLTWLENRARARTGMSSLPKSGFIDRYVAGVLYPANTTVVAQALAFAAAGASWIVFAVNHRERRCATCLVS